MKYGRPEQVNPSVAFNALRLIAEMAATQDHMFHDLSALCTSMDADEGQVWRIVDDAQRLWDKIKEEEARAVEYFSARGPAFDILGHTAVHLLHTKATPSLSVFLGDGRGWVVISVLEDGTISLELLDSHQYEVLNEELWEDATHCCNRHYYPSADDGHNYGVELDDGTVARFMTEAAPSIFYRMMHDDGDIEVVASIDEAVGCGKLYYVDKPGDAEPYAAVCSSGHVVRTGTANEARRCLRGAVDEDGVERLVRFRPEADICGHVTEIDADYVTELRVRFLPGEIYDETHIVEHIADLQAALQGRLNHDQKKVLDRWVAHAMILPFTAIIEEAEGQ